MDDLEIYEKINMISNFIYRYFDRINLKSKTYDFEVDSDDSVMMSQLLKVITIQNNL